MNTMRNVVKVLLAVIALLTFGGPGRSLEVHDIDRVVGLLEQLSGDLGKLSYDGEAAEIWFEEDAMGAGRIEAAGYDLDSWKAALDATMKGYFAGMSQAQIDGAFARVPDFTGRTDMTDEQKAVLSSMMEEHRAMIDRWRAEGAADAARVRPYTARIAAALE